MTARGIHVLGPVAQTICYVTCVGGGSVFCYSLFLLTTCAIVLPVARTVHVTVLCHNFLIMLFFLDNGDKLLRTHLSFTGKSRLGCGEFICRISKLHKWCPHLYQRNRCIHRHLKKIPTRYTPKNKTCTPPTQTPNFPISRLPLSAPARQGCGGGRSRVRNRQQR